MNLLQQAADWLEAQRDTHATLPATYQRDVKQVALNVTPGKTEVEQTDADGLTVRAEILDFLLLSDVLVLGGGKTEPKEGDLIKVARDGRTDVFEVVALPGDGPWRYSDSYGNTFRIHSQWIGSE